MKKFYLFIALFVLAALSAAPVNAQNQLFYAADGSPALRIYNGYTGTLTVAIDAAGASATNQVILDGLVNTVDGSGNTDTISELAAVIAACTNRAGSAKLVVDSDCSISTDSTDGELLSGTYTTNSGSWLVIPWDTSAILKYSAYVPKAGWKDRDGADIRNQGVGNSYTLDSVFGDFTGTGNVTLNAYIGGSLAYQRVYTSPVYVNAASTSTNATENGIAFDLPLSLRVAGQKPLLVEVKRATSATTGNIGIRLK